jgi:hypothetical protein
MRFPLDLGVQGWFCTVTVRRRLAGGGADTAIHARSRLEGQAECAGLTLELQRARRAEANAETAGPIARAFDKDIRKRKVGDHGVGRCAIGQLSAVAGVADAAQAR